MAPKVSRIPTPGKGPQAAIPSPAAEKCIALYKDYYRHQLALSPDDEQAMFAALARPLPVTFRLVGALSEGFPAEEVTQLDAQLAASLRSTHGASQEEGERAVQAPVDSDEMSVTNLEWYPHGAAWQLNVPKKRLKESRGLQAFLLREVAVGTLVRMEMVSMIPAIALGVLPGDLVLDLCAAPGSKTGQLLEMVVPSRALQGAAAGDSARYGAVVANDPDIKRGRMMIHRAKALCSPSLIVTALPGQSFPVLHFDGAPLLFDRVLCDVPCSGDGTVRKSHYLLHKWHPAHALQLHILQVALLRRSAEVTREGGNLVYSTCSLNPVENEAVVAAVVAAAGGALEICSPEAVQRFRSRPGLTSWQIPDMNVEGVFYPTYDEVPETKPEKAASRGRERFSRRGLQRSMFPPEDASMGLEKCMRVLPQDQDTGGFFVALLRKVGPVHFPSASSSLAHDDAPALSDPASDPVSDPVSDPASDAPGDSDAPGGGGGGKAARGRDVGGAEAYARRCTREEGVEARVAAVEPYVPLLSVEERGPAIWGQVQEFFGIAPTFPEGQLLAHSTRVKKVTFVTAAARRALDAAQAPDGKGKAPEEEGGGEKAAVLNVVTAGTQIFELNICDYCPSCEYRLCMDGLPWLLPHMTKRVAKIPRATMVELLEKRTLPLEQTPQEMQDMPPGSMVGVVEGGCGGARGGDVAVVLWKGKGTVKLWVTKEEAESLLAAMLSATTSEI